MTGRAKKICSAVGCTTLVASGSRCVTHKSDGRFQQRRGTPRTATTEWKKIRATVLRRDPMCQIRRPDICTGLSQICDHIRCVAAGGSDDLRNLRGSCKACSDWHTSQEAHYLAGHNVPCPWPSNSDSKPVVPQPIPARAVSDTKAFVPRTIWIG